MRTALAVAVCCVAGCAPLASFRPASGLMPGRDVEFGAGATVITARPELDEPLRGTGQAWTTAEASRSLSLSLIAAFDHEAFALGGALRVNLLRRADAALGVEAELGWAWLALSLPVAARVFDQTWVYSAPRAGNFGANLLLSLPLGASARIVDGFMLRPEAQLSAQSLELVGPRVHFGAAAAYQD